MLKSNTSELHYGGLLLLLRHNTAVVVLIISLRKHFCISHSFRSQDQRSPVISSCSILNTDHLLFCLLCFYNFWDGFFLHCTDWPQMWDFSLFSFLQLQYVPPCLLLMLKECKFSLWYTNPCWISFPFLSYPFSFLSSK